MRLGEQRVGHLAAVHFRVAVLRALRAARPRPAGARALRLRAARPARAAPAPARPLRHLPPGTISQQSTSVSLCWYLPAASSPLRT